MNKSLWTFRKSFTAGLLALCMLVVSSCDDENGGFTPLLIKVTVPDGYLDGEIVYIVASSADGNVITFTQLQDGEVNELSSESYTEGTFTLSVVNRYVGTSYKDLYGTSFLGVQRGLEIDLPEYEEEDYGYFQLTGTNFDLNASEYSISGNGGYGSYIDSEYPTTWIDITTSPSRIFITKYDANFNPTGFMYPSATYADAGQFEVNLSGTYTAFQTETVNFSQTTYASVDVYGLPTANNFTQMFEVSESDNFGTSLTVRYPGTTFPAYASYSYVWGEDYEYEGFSKTKKHDFDVPDANISINATGGSATYTATGEFDFMYFDFEQGPNDDEEYIEWSIYAPAGSNKTAAIPDIPTDITTGFSFSSSAWALEDYAALRVAGINSMNELVLSDASGDDYLEYKGLYFYSNAAGRKPAARMDVSAPTRNHKVINFADFRQGLRVSESKRTK